MTFRLVDAGWGDELTTAAIADASALRIVCPFIKNGALKRLLDGRRFGLVQVVTRFNLADLAEGVSDLAALRTLLAAGAQVRGVRGLHAKLYLFGGSRAVVTSANLTQAALTHNHELGCVASDPAIVARCRAYFDDLWSRSGSDLTPERLDAWDAKVTHYLASGACPDVAGSLADEGADAGLSSVLPTYGTLMGEVQQAFVKFLGEGNNRVPLSFPTTKELERPGCHWAVAYPASKRPRGVEDGALIFISRLTENPNDIRVFGRATALRHVMGRDDATAEDIALRPWKEDWSRYIRVHHAEFVAGTMANGISLNELMAVLGADSFASTQRNVARGEGNTNPRQAYRQQPAVELSPQAAAWLKSHLERAFATHGRVPPSDLARLDWPELPPT
jgi:hypothetical protein